MAKRESVQLPPKEEQDPEKNIYFATVDKKNIQFIKSGCRLLDCVLGGGWPFGRVSNIVGDRSAGKSLLAMEACANAHIDYPDAKIYYAESEAAFDEDYAIALGIPVEEIYFPENEDNTVETLYEILDEEILPEHENTGVPGLFIIDSLDALSDRAEVKRKIDDATFGGDKPKKLSEFFRRLTKRIEKSSLHLMVISQVRDNIGVSFGPKHTRSGGKALDFYASQILWLAEKKKLKKTISKIDRPVGVQVVANCKKNKVGLPFRTCEFPIYFGYGMDDFIAHLEFINAAGALPAIEHITGIKGRSVAQKVITAWIRSFKSDVTNEDLNEIREDLNEIVIDTWQEIEKSFLPKYSKY